jgi:wyosine [tRNA(Phe)-imidazoG37] synthetase (radical SAM superfamily)
MFEFARIYHGELSTETMLVKDVNDTRAHAEEVANFLSQLNPVKAYLSIPTRPPAERWVQPPNEQVMNQVYQILSRRIDGVEFLIGYEGNAFAFTGNIEEDLLSITAVHPMRKEAVLELLTKARADWSIIQNLMNQGRLLETDYQGQKFYMRRIVGMKRNIDFKILN